MAQAPNTHGATGATTRRKRLVNADGIRRSASNEPCCLRSANLVSGTGHSATADTAAKITVTT